MRRSTRTPKKIEAYDPDEESSKPQLASAKKKPARARKAKITRNYVGTESVLSALRPTDFEDNKAHGSNELRAEIHHDYNEAHMAEDAAHYKHHKPKKRLGRSPSPKGQSSRALDPEDTSFLSLEMLMLLVFVAAFGQYYGAFDEVLKFVVAKLEEYSQ